ncbi:MAG: nucleotide sugar dehydrogenase, partial [Myxococcota bacterium]|nr:nucleotide sugar dehydrogenase [Myxococcota bacterium]
ESATKSIAPYLRSGNLIILESTSPVGTTETMERIVREMRPELFTNDSSLLFAHCPERVLPGQILHEIVQNDRVVGGVDSESTASAADFYRSFVQGKVIETSCRAAELTKLVENSFRDTNIAFANELSLICDELEIDVWEVIALANRHPRVNILRPGPGVGGHCLAVDPWFIVSAAPQTARLIRNAREVNEGKPDWVIQRTLQHAQKLKQPKVGCLGLSYKPNIDDLRESPALHIARELVTQLPPNSVFACEPHITSLEGIELRTLEETLASADILIGLVAHDHFRDISPKAFNGKLVLDICGMFR